MLDMLGSLFNMGGPMSKVLGGLFNMRGSYVKSPGGAFQHRPPYRKDPPALNILAFPSLERFFMYSNLGKC